LLVVIDFRKILKGIKFVFICFFILMTITITISILFPLKHIELINKYSQKYGLEPSLVCAVINVESKFDENAVSERGASGLMQLMKPTADWLAQINNISDYNYNNIFNPELNINLGCFYLSKLMNQHNNDLILVLASYNAGSGNVNKWLYDSRYSINGNLINIPFMETKKYVKKVNTNKKVYEIILKLVKSNR